jgi:hypothetical protein
MSEQQAQTAKAVYEQLVAARKELAQLIGVRPYLCGLSLHAPGMRPIKLEGMQAEKLACAAQVAEAWISARIATLEQQLAEL